MHDVVGSALGGLGEGLFELTPFGASQFDHPAVIVAEDDLVGIGEVNRGATALHTAERDDPFLDVTGLQFLVHLRILHCEPEVAIQPESRI